MNTRIRRIITDHGSDPRIGTRWAWLVGVLALGTTVSVAVAQPRPAGPEPRDAPPQGGFRQRQEVDGRNKPEVATERQALERLIQQLSRQAQEKEAALNRNRDLPAEERQVQQIELRLLDEQIAQMKRRLAAPRAEPTTKGELRESQGRRPPEQTLDFLRQSREDLARRGREVERELRELPEGQEERARGLKSELESIHNKMARIDKQMAESPRRPAEPKRAGAEEARREPQPRKQALVERQAGLREQIARLERQLQERKARGEGESPESRELLERLRGLRAELQTSPEGRPPKMQPPLTPVKPMMPEKSMGDRNLQGQVEELRGQMKELQGQMQRMQKLLEQMNQRGGTNEPQKRSMY